MATKVVFFFFEILLLTFITTLLLFQFRIFYRMLKITTTSRSLLQSQILNENVQFLEQFTPSALSESLLYANKQVVQLKYL